MIEEMKEFSGIGETRRTLQYVTLFVIALFWVYEGYRTFALYRFSLMGWGFNVLFLLLYLWRTAFSYTYALTPSHFIIIMYGLGIERRLSISLNDMESFSNHYKKSFFRKRRLAAIPIVTLHLIPIPSASWSIGRERNFAACSLSVQTA